MKSRIMIFALAILSLVMLNSCVINQTSTIAQSTTKPPEPVVDYLTLLSSLRATGASITEAEELTQPFLSVKAKIIILNGSRIQVFEYENSGAMEAESKNVSSDGTTVNLSSISWISTPHFYRNGRLMVIYIGDDKAITTLLANTLGMQFAGR
jgi:hypothetical protein